MYKIEVIVSGETPSADQFVEEVTEAIEDLNEAWTTAKETLPEADQAATEARVRQVLK